MSNFLNSPWLSMWFHPKKTIRALVDTKVRYGFGFLSFFYGMPLSLLIVQVSGVGSTGSLWGAILMMLLFAPFLGVFWFCFLSGLLFLTGKWIKGKASFLQIRAAVSWSYLPCLLPAFGTIAMILLFRDFVFFSWAPGAIAEHAIFWYLLVMFFLPVIAMIWECILLVFSVAEVQGFSLWKAILNLILSIGVLFIASMVLGTVLSILSGNL